MIVTKITFTDFQIEPLQYTISVKFLSFNLFEVETLTFKLICFGHTCNFTPYMTN